MRSMVLGLCLGLMLPMAAAAQDISPQLATLHDALRLTPDQEAAWAAYVAQIRPDPQVIAGRQAADLLLPQLPTPRRIALIDAIMERDSADRLRQEAAVKVFYAQLTADQQRSFDLQTRPAAAGPEQGAGPN